MKKLLLALLLSVPAFAGTVTTLVKNESGVCSQDVNFTAAFFAIAGESALTTSDWAAPGAIGATTPAAGAFTTATANAFIPNSATVPANGVYLPAANSVGIATDSTERLRIDAAGNLGLGVVPSAWGTLNAIEMNGGSVSAYSTTQLFLSQNAYYNSGWKYKATASAAQYLQDANGHQWYNAPSGTAGAAITFTQAMTLAASGNLLIGTTAEASPTAARCVIKGSTADGTTNVLELQDSNGAAVLNVNTDGILTHKGTYGEIYVADGSTAQTIATGVSYTKLTPFTAEADYSDCTPSAANDQITLTRAGKYMVTINWSGAVSLANSSWDFAVFKNSTEQSQIHASRKFAAVDIGSLTLAGIVTVAANDVLSLQVLHDNGGSLDITTHDCGFSVYYLGY